MAVSSAEAPRSFVDFAPFEPFLREYGTTIRILEEARRFASVDPDSSSAAAPVAELDEAALLLGIGAVGLEMRGVNSSTTWFVEWLQAGGVKVDEILSEQRELSGASQVPLNGAAVPSESVRTRVLPLAVALARSTVKRERADARHLLFALMSQPPGNFEPFNDRVDARTLLQARQMIVDRMQSSHEEGEDLNAWQQFVAEPLLAERADWPSEAQAASGEGATAGQAVFTEEPPRPAETVGTLSDAPALVDALGRQAFAEVLASRVKQVSETLRSGTLGNDSAFILHVDGPWGSGKSSILNFLKTDLEQSDPQWLIVEFNAWRNQQRSPAWWPIISHVWGAVRRGSPLKFKMARWVWLRWTIRMRWIPVALSAVLTGVLLYFAWQAVAGHTEGVAGAVKDIGAAVLALATLAGLALTTSRTIFFGSKNAAEAYVQSTVEPYRPIVRLYERLISAIGCPVAVFIDDIDRCEANYVIELLEGIQTLLRSAPVVYVVAGDRKWICSSFEKRYADFGGQIGMPGRPLGYLFLDKVFQLSTAIPRLSTVRQADYWKRLLETGEGARSTPQDVKQLEAEAEKELEGKTSHEEIQAQIDRTEEGSLERETIRAAAAKQTTSREAMRAAEHRLQPLSHLLEPNPRSMKRLVNAYGLNQARAFLEGRTVEVEALARWTIVELRWPILADYLASNWTDIADHSLSVAQFPEGIRALLADSDVKEVFGHADDAEQLTLATLGPILE
jgi:hypothetical protein